MKIKYDISQFVNYLTEEKVIEHLVNSEVQRRKELKLSQKELAVKSGVSYASIRRFESTGEISLTSLLKIANIIDCLDDFMKVFCNRKISNLKEYFND